MFLGPVCCESKLHTTTFFSPLKSRNQMRKLCKKQARLGVKVKAGAFLTYSARKDRNETVHCEDTVDQTSK